MQHKCPKMILYTGLTGCDTICTYPVISYHISGYSSRILRRLFYYGFDFSPECGHSVSDKAISCHLLMGHSLGSDVEKSVYGHRTVEELRAEIEKIQVPDCR